MLHNLCLYLFIAISDKMRLAHVLRMWLTTRGARCQTETACLPPGSLSGTSVSSNKLLTVHRKLNFKNKRQPYSHLSHLQDRGRREEGERTIGTLSLASGTGDKSANCSNYTEARVRATNSGRTCQLCTIISPWKSPGSADLLVFP